MSMALNSVGNKGRTRVRRGLMDQTGIRSHQINKAVKTIRAGGGRLQYALEARAGETNISMFGLKVTWREGSAMGQIRMLQTVSAAPWNTRRVFPGVCSRSRSMATGYSSAAALVASPSRPSTAPTWHSRS